MNLPSWPCPALEVCPFCWSASSALTTLTNTPRVRFVGCASSSRSNVVFGIPAAVARHRRESPHDLRIFRSVILAMLASSRSCTRLSASFPRYPHNYAPFLDAIFLDAALLATAAQISASNS